MFIPLFICFGFFIAVLYIDLVFDISALPYRKSKSELPPEVVTPIVSYYRLITKDPWLLMSFFFVATGCLLAEIKYSLVPSRIGYASMMMLGLIMLLAVARVIPRAQRLASGKETAQKQAFYIHSLFPYHIILLILVLALTLLQFSAT